MTNKNTRNALFMSVVAMILCFTMLLGTTFAWFTDSVSSARNMIVSGNLDVELYYSKLDANGNWTEYAEVDENTKVFDDNALYEPGYTEVVKFKVVNAGSLAFKYNLDVAVNSETKGTNKANTEFALSDYLYVAAIDDVASVTSRDVAAKAADKALKNGFAIRTNEEFKANTADQEFVLVLTMPTTVGNEANHLKGKQPSIELGIDLFATQLTYEKDSFGDDYDENAPFSLWDGVVPTEMPESLVVNGDTQTIHVQDAAAFAYLSTLSAKWADFYTDGNGRTFTNYANGAGTNYYYSGQWTVSLEADIDLGNYEIAPVEIVLGENCGYSAFNGNNHTIRNINTTTGLFADMTRTNYSNLVLENVKATKGALTGISGSSITNVTVINATISGVDYIGGLVGRVFGGVSYCEVIDSSVVATGKEAGGLIGYAEANSAGFVIANNTVKNVSVYADNRAAGLVAQPNVNIKVYNNTVDTVTVGAADTSTYQPGAVASNALAPENVYNNTVINANIAAKAAFAADNASLGTAIADGADTLFLGSGNYVIPTAAQKKTLSIIGNKDTAIATKTSGSYEGCNYALDGSTVVFENITITTDGKDFTGYARCDATFKNCVINNTIFLYGDTVFENCTFNDEGNSYNVWTYGAPTAKFVNCVFNCEGKSIYVDGNGTTGTKVTVEGCTFNDLGDNTVVDNKAAIETGTTYGKTYELIIDNTVVNGFAVNSTGLNTGTTLWANKNSMGTDKLNVVVDGVDVY